MLLLQGLFRHLGDHVHQLIDGDEHVGAQVQGIAPLGMHEAVDALNAVIDVHERPRLLAITPDLDLVAVLGERHLATDRRGGLLAAAVVGSERAVDVVEASDSSFEAVILAVVLAELFRVELLPAVSFFGLRGNRVFFLQRRDVRAVLLVGRVDARRRRIEIPRRTVRAGCLEHVGIDQHVVARDVRVVTRDVPDPSHVGGELVDMVDPAGGDQAIVPTSQIEELEFVRGAGLVLGLLDVHSPNPVPIADQVFDQMMPDEPSSPGHQNARRHDVSCGRTLV